LLYGIHITHFFSLSRLSLSQQAGRFYCEFEKDWSVASFYCMGFSRLATGPFGFCPGNSVTSGNAARGKPVRTDASTCTGRASGSGSATKGR
jgi:hypothetical protein